MPTSRGSRKIEAATRRLESARSHVLSAWAEREAWTAQCAGLKRGIDELQRSVDELRRTLVAAESNGEAAGKKLQTCEAEADEAERALRSAEGRYGNGAEDRGGSSGAVHPAGSAGDGRGDDDVRGGGESSPGPRRVAGPPQTPQPRHPSRKKNSSVHERISRARVFLETQRDESGAGGASTTARPIPEDLSVAPASPGGTDGYDGASPGRPSSASVTSCSSRAVSPSPSSRAGGGEADGPAVVVEGAGFGAANGTYRRSPSHSSPTYSMPGSWLWRSGRYVLHRETNSSWRLGFWPEADMSSFPGVCSQDYTLYRSGPSGDGNGNTWEVVPSAEGSTPELSTSARVPAPRVSVIGGDVPRLDDPSTTVEAVRGGAVIRSDGGGVADDGRPPTTPPSKRSTTPDGGARRTRTRVQSNSFPPGPSKEGSSAPNGVRERSPSTPPVPSASSFPLASPSPLSAALARRASLAAGTADSITVSGAGTPEVNGLYTRHPDHLLDGCPVYGRTFSAGGGTRRGPKRTMAICRVTANNGRFWFIKEKGSGHYYCAREREADVPPRVGWRVSSSLSGTSPPPRLDW